MTLTRLIAANAAAAAAGAGKKAAQVQLQAELNTNDDWRKFIAKDGLLVIDVYSEWCGPCIGMVGNLKKIKVEIGGDNLHLAIARADTIDCLKRFRNRSEPTWMFIAAGQLLNVIFGADAPRLTRTIIQELKNEEAVKKGERERPQRAPDELTPLEQEAVNAEEERLIKKQAKETAAVEAARRARRDARAARLETHFCDVCPALMMPHAQKHLRKVSDALEPCGIMVADKCPLLLSKDGVRILGAEDERLKSPPVVAALIERPSLTLLLKKMADVEGDVIALVRKALCGEGLEEDAPKKIVVDELVAEGIPGLFIPADRQQRAVALDLLFPKMVSSMVEPPAIVEPPHVALVYGAWQRRAVLNVAALAHVAPRLLRYGFFADLNLEEPKLLVKTLEKYEDRPEKDYCETIILMVSVGPADPYLVDSDEKPPDGPPKELLALGPIHVSVDAVVGADECSRLFPPGYSEPEHKPKPKTKKRKKKRDTKEENSEDHPADNTPQTNDKEASPEVEDGAERDAEDGEVDGDGEGENDGDLEGEEEEGENNLGVDKATSPLPQTPH